MPKKRHRRGNRPQTQQLELVDNDLPPVLSPQKHAEIRNLHCTLVDELQDHPEVLSDIMDFMAEKPSEEVSLIYHLQRMSRILRDFPHLFEQCISLFPPSLRAKVSQTRLFEDTDASDSRTRMTAMDSSYRTETLARASAAFRAAASSPTSMHAAAPGRSHNGPGSAHHGHWDLPYTPIRVPVSWGVCPDCAREMLEERQREAERRKLRFLRDVFRLYFPNGERVLADTLWLIVGLLLVGILVKVYL